MNYFTEQQRGYLRPVLFEHAEKNGNMEGYSDNYIKVSIPYNQNFVNNITNLQVIGAGLFVEIRSASTTLVNYSYAQYSVWKLDCGRLATSMGGRQVMSFLTRHEPSGLFVQLVPFDS